MYSNTNISVFIRILVQISTYSDTNNSINICIPVRLLLCNIIIICIFV